VSGYASEYKEQWQWNNTGQSQGTGRAGKPGADIRVEKAWTLTKGKGMCIAVVDCGFRWKHNDLLRAVLSHSATVHSGPESVSVSIGCVAMPSDEKNPHGTPCASNAAAPGAAAGRICGAAPEASLLLVAIESWASGPGIAKALHYAAFPACYQFPAVPPSRIRGADVISFSRKLGGLEPGSADCVKTALGDLSKGRDGLGIPFFYAAPHRKLDGDQSGFPVDFATEHDVVLTIGATDRSDMALRQGPKPEFVAPGESVFMADPRGEDMADYNSGTSFAAPVAAGVAALVLSKRPCLSVSELRRLMRASCDKVGSGVYGTDGYDTTERYGFGRINAARAVGAVRPPPDWLSWTLPPH
jgi:thermitase